MNAAVSLGLPLAGVLDAVICEQKCKIETSQRTGVRRSHKIIQCAVPE